MSNIFQEVLGNLDKVEEELLGPTYDYWSKIKSPSEMGMSSDGSLSTLANNFAGLISYSDLLISGGGEASKHEGPLGDKYFLETAATCSDKKTGKTVTRDVYINNVPDGNIPFIKSGMGKSFSKSKGIVPGIMGNAASLNPMKLLQAFMIGSNPECQSVTLETINADGDKSSDTKFITTVDLQNMNACWFTDGKNPVSGDSCSEGFALRPKNIKHDRLIQLYYGALGVLGLYILFKCLYRKK